MDTITRHVYKREARATGADRRCKGAVDRDGRLAILLAHALNLLLGA
jgi:hypothetical protein